MEGNNSSQNLRFERQEIEAVIVVGVIMAIRLLGVFLILPVFSVYVERYPGASLTLAGVAFGIYALAQSLLQIPFGWISDRVGRKPVLVLGLILFTVGSILCAIVDNLTELIFTRIIQGSGAISSVAIASLGDLTRSQMRARSFTIVGLIIGAAFIIGIIAGPLLAAQMGFSMLFYILAALGALAITVTLLFFPHIQKDSIITQRFNVLGFLDSLEIRRLLISALILSFTVNLFVFIYPLSWTSAGVGAGDLWHVYLVTLIPTMLFIYPFIRRAERLGKLRNVTLGAWALIALSFLIYPANAWTSSVLYLVGMIYFASHAVLQSLFPAFLTQRVGQESRGATTGFYNLLAFFGASLGGILAGYLYEMSEHLPLILSLLLIIAWGLTGLPMPPQSKS